jgi:hypothetical protein
MGYVGRSLQIGDGRGRLFLDFGLGYANIGNINYLAWDINLGVGLKIGN